MSAEPGLTKRPGEPLTEADLLVPGGATEPLWYLMAAYLAPEGIGSTARRAWVEGFVAALEAVRGIDGEPGMSAVLRDTTEQTYSEVT